jgi:hypothetical protein
MYNSHCRVTASQTNMFPRQQLDYDNENDITQNYRYSATSQVLGLSYEASNLRKQECGNVLPRKLAEAVEFLIYVQEARDKYVSGWGQLLS